MSGRSTAQSDQLPTNVLFLARTHYSPTLAEQRAACEAEGDIVVDAGQVSFEDLPRQLARQGHELMSGDRIKVYDLACLPMNTKTLIRVMMRVLKKGIAIEFCKPQLLFQPPEIGGELFRAIEALDAHWRLVHGIKTHPSEAKMGRKALLSVEQLPDIRRRLEAKEISMTSLAKELGVARSTLFNFLRRHDPHAAADA